VGQLDLMPENTFVARTDAARSVFGMTSETPLGLGEFLALLGKRNRLVRKLGARLRGGEEIRGRRLHAGHLVRFASLPEFVLGRFKHVDLREHSRVRSPAILRTKDLMFAGN